MLNSGVHVEVKQAGHTWDDPGRVWYGQIVRAEPHSFLVRLGGGDSQHQVPREDVRLHSAQRELRRAAPTKKKHKLREIVVIPCNATGDMFGITVSLMLEPDVGVLILQEAELTAGEVHDAGTTPTMMEGMLGIDAPHTVLQPSEDGFKRRQVVRWDPNNKCKSLEIERFIRDSLGPGRSYQVFTLPVEDSTSWYGKLTRSAAGPIRDAAKAYACINARNAVCGILQALPSTTESGKLGTLNDVGRGTQKLVLPKRQDIVMKAREHWTLPTSKALVPKSDIDHQARMLLGAKKNTVLAPASRYIVLWSRFSGKRGGPHPQHDTSYEGMSQLIDLASAAGLGVILAGDRSWSSAKADKVLRSAAKVHWDFREIWKDPLWTLYFKTFSQLNPRLLQMKFFDFLNRELGGVIHLGMRSGNLESFSLMGHRVHYMEERGIEDAARMQKWHTPLYQQTPVDPQKAQIKENKAKNNLVNGVRYDRIIIEKPPTRTGKFIVSELHKEKQLRLVDKERTKLADNEIHPWRNQLAGERTTIKHEALGDDHAKGFEEGDVALLGDWMRLFAQKAKIVINTDRFSDWELLKNPK